MIKGKKVKDSAGKWTSSSKKVATVNKNGVVKVTGAGTATIKFTDKKSKKTASVKIYGRVRAAKMMLTPAAVMVKEGESADVAVSYELSKKVQAAGGKETTYKLFAESSDTSVATVTAEGTKVTVKGVKQSATPVAITVYAAQVSNLEKAKEVKIKLTEKFDVKVTGSLEAKQSGANKITVMGTDLVASKSAYVLTNANGVKVDLKDAVVDNKTIKDTVMVNADKTEATLEGNTLQLPVGKYKLSYNGGEPVEFEVVKAVVKRIELSPSNTAIMVKKTVNGVNQYASAYTYYKVFNQFDEDITKSPLSANIKVSGSDNPVDAPKGKITFTPSNPYQLNLSKISVAVVDLDTGVNTSAILTTGEESKVWASEFKGIYNMVTRKYVENIDDDSKLEDYRLLFKVKDQYGHDISGEEATKDQLLVTLLSTTGVVANNDTVKLFDMGNDDWYYAYKLDNTSRDDAGNKMTIPSREGEVTLQAIVRNNGKIEAKKFNVVASNKVDTLVVRGSANGVYSEQGNWLDFTALDASGKEVTSWDKIKVLNNQKYTKNFNKTKPGLSELYFTKKDNGKIGLWYKPVGLNINDDSMVSPQVLSFVTPTNKFATATINVRAKRRPVALIGLTSDAARGVTHNGKSLEFKAKQLRFQDQFGNEMKASEFASDAGTYKIVSELSDVTSVVDNYFSYDAVKTPTTVENNVTFVSKAIKSEDDVVLAINADITKDTTGSSKVSFELKSDNKTLQDELNKTTEKKSFEVYNVLLDDMSSFDIKDPGLKAASNLPGPITGLTSDQKNFTYADSVLSFSPEVFGYYAGEKIKLASDDYTVFGTDGKTEIPAIDDKTLVTKSGTIKVTINDNKPTVKDREFKYSNEARRFAAVDIKNTKFTLPSDATWANIMDKAGITLKDQYGDTITGVKPFVTLVDYDKDVVKFNKTKDYNGTQDIVVNYADSTVVTLKLTMPGSTYSWEKVVRLTK